MAGRPQSACLLYDPALRLTEANEQAARWLASLGRSRSEALGKPFRLFWGEQYFDPVFEEALLVSASTANITHYCTIASLPSTTTTLHYCTTVPLPSTTKSHYHCTTKPLPLHHFHAPLQTLLRGLPDASAGRRCIGQDVLPTARYRYQS